MANDKWDYSFDTVVVGSGNGGITAALCAYEMGLKDVLVIEKSDLYGGTSATSGGGVWVPNNRYAKAAGAQDSWDEAKEYLSHTIPADQVPEDMIDTYLTSGPKMIDFLHERTRVRYQTLAHYPDYYTNLPGGKPGHRSMEPEPVDITVLGDDANKLRPTHHMMYMLGLIGITQVEAHDLMAQLPGWQKIAGKLLFKYLIDVPYRLRSKRHRRLTCGTAGVARLRWSMLDRDMPLWLETSMKELITDDSGRVIGLIAEKRGETLRIQARKGVVLAAGGFEQNQAKRDEYLPKPTRKEWSGGIKSNTGDAIWEGMRLGAATRLLNQGWWCMTVTPPGDEVPSLSIMEKSYPGSCLVNAAGKRFANESQNYMAFQLNLYKAHTEENPCAPAYQVFDARFRRDYIVGPLMSSSLKPDWMIPKRWFDEKFVAKSDTIRGLAEQMGIDANGLEETIAKMNEYARTGKDEEFGRGDSTYDRYYGDPRISPNPCLAPIQEAPFYAMRVDAGDFGTQGGLVTSTDAQVLREDGSAIEGLYAIGNCSAAVLPTYPGPGSTLGPAMTFGYQAAKHMSGYQD